MRVLCFFSAFFFLLATASQAGERPFISDHTQAEYLKTVEFLGISLNAPVEGLIEHFKLQGYINVQDMPLGLKGRNVTMRNPSAMGSSVTIIDVPSTGMRKTSIGLRATSTGKGWRDTPYSSDLQGIIDTVCEGDLEQITSQIEAIHCAESAGILYVFANVTDSSGVKYRLEIMATADAMLRISYSHD